MANAVQQHDLALLAAVAERVEHAHEGRQTGARGDEECRPPIVLQQEPALGAFDVDRIAQLPIPEQVGECSAFNQADEELVLGQIVGGRGNGHRPLDQLASRTHETQGRVLAGLEGEGLLETLDTHDGQTGGNFLPPAQAAVVRIGIAHSRQSCRLGRATD